MEDSGFAFSSVVLIMEDFPKEVQYFILKGFGNLTQKRKFFGEIRMEHVC